MVKVKQNLVAPQQASPYVINLPQPPVRNAEEYLKAYIGYVYAAVGAIAQEVASIELHLYQVKYVKGKPQTQEIYQHPILSLLDYVNELETFYNLVEATQTYLELTGEAFWVILKEGNTPSEIWLLRPDWVKVIPSATEVIDHYNYYPGGIITQEVQIPKENIVPFKYFNPMNPYRGKGPTQAAALPFDILNFAQEYNRNFFFNSAIPSMVFSTEQKISETTTKRFLNQWQSTFGGRTKSNKIAFLGNGMKLDKASFAGKELDFANLMPAMRDDVLAVYKVPKTVLGLTEDVNKANAQATTMAFMERTITPKDRKFVDTLNEFLLPMYIGQENGMMFLDFTDPSPQDVELQLKRYQSGRMYTWMTPNEIRVEENMEPMEGGDDLFAPLGSPQGSVNSQSDPNEDNTASGSGDKNDEPQEAPEDDPKNDESPSKPQANDEPEEDSFSGRLRRFLNGSRQKKVKKPYVPPAYLKNYQKRVFGIGKRGRKHMVNVPQLTPKNLKAQTLAAEFVAPLKKFIGQMLSQDKYEPLKKKGRLTKQEKQMKEIIEKSLTAKSAEVKEEVEKRVKLKATKSELTDEQKKEYWKAFVDTVAEREALIKEKVQAVFAEQERMVLNSLQDHMKSWRRRLGIKAQPGDIVPTLEDLGKMWTTLQLILREIYIEQGNQTLSEVGVGGQISITTSFATQYLQEYGGQLIKGIDDTTREQLMSSLAAGFEAGEGVDKLSARVQDIFTVANSARADMIARTESLRASNEANVEAYRQSGVVSGKEWLAEMDGETCPVCEAQNGRVISLDDDYFSKGDEATVNGYTVKFDYTDIGAPPAHVDCRCTTLPVLFDANGEGE